VIGLVDDVEFEFRGGHGRPALFGQSRDLPLQDGARRMGQLFMAAMVEQVGQHQGGPLEPGHPAQAFHDRLDDEVAVAERPGRRLIAGHRLHFHVDRQQIVAAVGLLDHAVEEEARRHALAHQAALHVREGDHDRVDLASLDQLLQPAQFKKSVHRAPLLPRHRGLSHHGADGEFLLPAGPAVRTRCDEIRTSLLR
jgi:hypothetical protein